MAPQGQVVSQDVASGSRAERALRELDDGAFSDVVSRELHRRSTFTRVADQIDGTLRSVRAPAGNPRRAVDPLATSRRDMVASLAPVAALLVPHVCSIEAGEILARRGVLSSATPTDALRRFARDGRLIVLRGDRRWVYPRFQLDHFDPRDPENVISVVNKLLDAGRLAQEATSWWVSPSAAPSAALAGRDEAVGLLAPVDLLGRDHDTLVRLATAYAVGAGV